MRKSSSLLYFLYISQSFFDETLARSIIRTQGILRTSPLPKYKMAVSILAPRLVPEDSPYTTANLRYFTPPPNGPLPLPSMNPTTDEFLA